MMQKNKLYLFYAIAFLEGASLMAIELIGAKLVAPYFGSSIYVWTSVFTTTLGGIALGYFLGGRLSTKENPEKILKTVLLFSAIYTAVLFPLSQWIMEGTIGLSIQLGSLISCLIVIFPVLLCFGMVSPLLIRILSDKKEEIGQKAGNVYTVSTFGGIIMTVLMGFYFIPYSGIKASLIITSCLLILAFGLSFLQRKTTV